MAIRKLTTPMDPILDVIFADTQNNRVFRQSLRGLPDPVVVSYRNTLHPSEGLLDAWYRFKENQTCQR